MTVLRDLLEFSLDGEWGKGEPDTDTVEMSVIRGSDFDNVSVGSVAGVPTRHLACRHAQRKTLRAYDIVFETAGGTKDRPTGRSLLLTPQRLARFELPVTCASFARFLRIAPDKADPAYVYWMLQHLYHSHELLRYHTQHTGVARFQFTTFADTHRLHLPAPHIQRRIAGILSAYDDLIEVNTRRIVLLEEIARRLFDEWFVDGRSAEKHRIARAPLSSFLATTIGGTWGTDSANSRSDAECRVIRGTDMPGWRAGMLDRIPTRFVPHKTFASRKLASGDVVVEVSGGSKDQPVGRSVLISGERLAMLGENVSFASFCRLARPNGEAVAPETLWLMFDWLYRSRRVLEYQTQSTGISNLKFSLLIEREKMPILSPKARSAFEGSAVPILKLIDVLAASCRVLRTARGFLLPKLISGEIDLERAEGETKRVAAE